MRNLLYNDTQSQTWAIVNSAVKKLKATLSNTEGEYVIGDWNKIKLVYVMDTSYGLVHFWLVENSTLTCKGDKLSGCSLMDVDAHVLVKTYGLIDVDQFYSTMCHENFHFNHWHFNACEDLSVESGARISEAAYRMTSKVRTDAQNKVTPFMIDNFEATPFNGWLYDEILEFRYANEDNTHDEALDIVGLLVLGADANMVQRYTFSRDKEKLIRVLQSLEKRHFKDWHAKQCVRGRVRVCDMELKSMIILLLNVIKIENHDI